MEGQVDQKDQKCPVRLTVIFPAGIISRCRHGLNYQFIIFFKIYLWSTFSTGGKIRLIQNLKGLEFPFGFKIRHFLTMKQPL